MVTEFWSAAVPETSEKVSALLALLYGGKGEIRAIVPGERSAGCLFTMPGLQGVAQISQLLKSLKCSALELGGDLNRLDRLRSR
jgi:hypothetical protein